MSQLFAGMYASASGALMLDLTNAQGVRFGTNEHGFSDFEAFYPCGLAESFRIYDRPGLPHVSVVGNGATAWEGRVEDVAIVNGGVRIKAFGYQRALSDAPYTALYADGRYNGWATLDPALDGNSTPQLYEMDNNNRLYVAPRKDETFGTTTITKYGGWLYVSPYNGTGGITRADWTFDVAGAANWTAYMYRLTFTAPATLTYLSTPWSSGSGTGTSSASFAACNALAFVFLYNAVDASFSGSTGQAYMKITGLSLKGTTSASPSQAEVAGSLASFVNSTNSTQLNSSTVLIGSPGLLLTDEVYHDTPPSEIMNRMTALGDTAGSAWEWGVYEGQIMHYRARGSAGRAWCVDATALEIERTIQSLTNSAYAVYNDANGRALRTAASTASDSIARYGLTRTGAVKVDTTSATQAGYTRDVALTDGKDPAPRIELEFDRLYDATGGNWPLWSCRSGDTITIRNLPPSVSSAVDRIRTFRVSETDYDAMRDVLRVTPELPAPTLDVLVSR